MNEQESAGKQVVHTIRLHGFWLQIGESNRWKRSFGCPANLSEKESICFVANCELESLELNGELIPVIQSGNESEATLANLQLRNSMVIGLKDSIISTDSLNARLEFRRMKSL